MSTTLLITTMNRSDLLRHTLTRLCELTLPDDILVVDDGGNDACGLMLQEFSDRLPIRYIYNNNPGPTICSMARNVGIKNTKADVIITSEPEVLFVTDVIAQLLAQHERNPTDVISAGVVHHAHSLNVREPSQCETIKGWVAPFTALYGRDWLLDVGGWDESFPGTWGWDDTDLLTRLRHSGHGQVIDAEIEILHQWHGSGRPNQSANEAHFLAKNLEHERTHVVANKGAPWGITKPT